MRRTAGTAFYLRMLGFDALCQIRGDDQDLPHTSASQNRILPTRDGSLLSAKLTAKGMRTKIPAARCERVLVSWHGEG